jgi:prepilin-type N-terminal cleavage/methylation domain-containing protein
MRRTPTGFTLLEMLTALAIIALLISTTMVVSSGIRRINRDTKRVSDISSIRAALFEYYQLNKNYPVALVTGQPLSSGSNIFLASIPSNPQPVDGDCPETATYQYLRHADGLDYTLNFCLASRTGDWGPGPNSVSAETESTCIPDCVLSCENGSDGCGGICAEITTCPDDSTCLNDHCVRN